MGAVSQLRAALAADTFDAAAFKVYHTVCTRFDEVLRHHESRQNCVFMKDSECVNADEWRLCTRALTTPTPVPDSAAFPEVERAQAVALLARLSSSYPDLGLHTAPSLPLRNVWIVKPTYLSKGEGIRCFDDAFDAVRYAATLDYDVVAQKYIERPLIVRGRKVHTRDWQSC